MARDRKPVRRRTGKARSAVLKDDGGSARAAGPRAIACAALARRGGQPARPDAPDAVDHVAASAADAVPMMLQD